MARRKREEEHENHERWLVSYADFITLLFAFFVVMYAVSSVNDGKYRVLSDALTAAFRSPMRSLTPLQIGQPSQTRQPGQSPADGLLQPIILPLPMRAEDGDKGKGSQGDAHRPGQQPAPVKPEAPGDRAPELGKIGEDVTNAMDRLIRDDLVKVRRNKRWLEIEIRSSVLFPSGSSHLSPKAIPVLEDIADILRPYPNPIHVEGFTDNRPIHNEVYPSNWELSAARAASVVHLFTDYGLKPSRFAAIGYGEYRPIASNATPAGRARNRRVVLVVLPNEDPRWTRSARDLGSPERQEARRRGLIRKALQDAARRQIQQSFRGGKP